MPRLISEILNIDQPSFFYQIKELERLIGKPGLDIRLANELKLMFKEKARLLKLDENDTTAKELYFSMAHKALDDSRELAGLIGIGDDDPPKKMVEKAVQFVEKRVGKRTVWVLKSNVARKQLKENPPKKLMKIFGIRSMDSALKRERISIFYCFAGFSESASWFSKYGVQADKLTNSDFDNQRLSISVLSSARCEQLSKAGIKLNQIVYCDQESAGIEVAVPDNRFKGDVLFLVDSLLVQIKNILHRSAYYKSQGMGPGFSAKVKKIRLNGFRSVESENYPFDWPTVMHAATELGVFGLVQSREPFISMEELLVPSAAQLGGFDFWKHPFGFYTEPGLVISFNLSDMIINAANNVQPEYAYAENGRKSLKNELFARYLSYEPVQREMANFNESPDQA